MTYILTNCDNCLDKSADVICEDCKTGFCSCCLHQFCGGFKIETMTHQFIVQDPLNKCRGAMIIINPRSKWCCKC